MLWSTIWRNSVFLLASLAALGTASARMMGPTGYAPVGRLAANVGKYIQEHPDDPNGYYVLGRIHSLAFTFKVARINYDGGSSGTLPSPSDFQSDWLFGESKRIAQPRPTEPELTRHLEPAVSNLSKALEMQPSIETAQLCLAYTLEMGADRAANVPILPHLQVTTSQSSSSVPASTLFDDLVKSSRADRAGLLRTRRTELSQAAAQAFQNRDSAVQNVREAASELLAAQWRECAIEHYRLAFEYAHVADLVSVKKASLSPAARLTSIEAATAYEKLVSARGATPEELVYKDQMKVLADEIRKHEQHFITPIIFSLEQVSPLEALIDSTCSVDFDLAGAGAREHWSWIAPNTGILVWDPNHTGRIESGRQLFGSVTWWMFFDNGYQALDLLDDNRDGELSGPELHGIAVWFDRNSNGVSDPGEVIPVERLGIVGIATHATAEFGSTLANLTGLQLTDGRYLPTYDWISQERP